jgi:peptide/nickel transport system substrate-binding protein
MRRLAALVLLMSLVSSCGLDSGSSSGKKADGDFVLTWAKEIDPTGINPLTTGFIHSWEIFSLVYQPLTSPNRDLTPGPGLAASWKQTSDTSWRFTLRDGVKFSDGRALTAEDIVETWNAYKKAAALVVLWPGLDTMTAVDQRTFDVKLKAPLPDLPKRFEMFWVLPGKDIAAGTFDPDKDLKGTGPFVSGKHVKGVSWTFTPNQYYWRKGLPHAKRVEIKFIPDDASRLAAVRTGAVDFTLTANPDIQKILTGDPRIKSHTQGTTDYYYLRPNPNKAVFRDKRVRQAIALAVDRKQLRDTALGGLGELSAVTGRGLPDSCDPNGVLGATARDVNRAKALLKEAGAGNVHFRLVVVPGLGATRAPQMAQVIQQNLSEIGVRMDISVLDTGAYLEQLRTGSLEAELSFFAGGGTEAQVLTYLDPKNGSVTRKVLETDPSYLEKIRAALSTPEGPGRKQAFAAACASLNDLAAFVPLLTKPSVIVYRADRISPVFAPVEPVQTTYRALAEFSPAQ